MQKDAFIVINVSPVRSSDPKKEVQINDCMLWPLCGHKAITKLQDRFCSNKNLYSNQNYSMKVFISQPYFGQNTVCGYIFKTGLWAPTGAYSGFIVRTPTLHEAFWHKNVEKIGGLGLRLGSVCKRIKGCFWTLFFKS